MGKSFEATGTGAEGEIQEYVVPGSRNYRISAAGAEGGALEQEYLAGRGARIAGTVYLEAGDIIKVLVGHQGGTNSTGGGQAGGGGSFVGKDVTPESHNYAGLNVVFLRRNTSITEYESATVTALEEKEHIVTTLSEADAETYDFSDAQVVIVGAPGTSYTSYPHESLLTGLSADIVSMCRDTSRNIFNMASSSGSTESGIFNLVESAHPIPGSVDRALIETIETTTHGISSLNSGVTLIYDNGDGGEAGVAEKVEENRTVRHMGYYRLDVISPDALRLFHAVIDPDSVAPAVEYEPLIVAGGGAGSNDDDINNPHGRVENDGPDHTAVGHGNNSGAGGGGGWRTRADGYLDNAGSGFMYGGAGGAIGGWAEGGFGGGGGKGDSYNDSGGGGGYSGGDHSYQSRDAGTSSGGGSYNSGTDQENHGGETDLGNLGHGWVTIEALIPVSGDAMTGDTHEAVDKVVFHKWDSNEFVDSVVPDSNGSWSEEFYEGVYSISYFKDGYQPITHGPYTVEPEDEETT